MSYLSIRQTAERWGISPRRIQVLCAENRIPGALRIGYSWAIPANAAKPKDERIKSGRYIRSSEKGDKMIRVRWTLEEAVVLVDQYFKKENYLDISEEEFDRLTQMYINRANELGIEIDEKFRNASGLKMQLGCIHYVATDGEQGMRNASKVFYKAYGLYQNSRDEFNNLVKDFYKKYDFK